MKFILIALLVTAIAVKANPSDRQQRQATNPSCPDACPAVYNPVCGSNRRHIRSFGNSCEMGVYNCNNIPSERYEVVPNHYCCKFVNGGAYNALITDNSLCTFRLA